LWRRISKKKRERIPPAFLPRPQYERIYWGLGRNFPFAPLFVLGEFGADMYALYCTLAKECKFSYYISMATGKKLGENLRKLRLKKNMSQGDLATVLSVDRAYISNIENGRMNPTLSTLEKIANALGISSSELLK